VTWLAGYTRRKRWTIASDVLASPVSNAEIVLRLAADADVGAAARPDGLDLKLTDSAGNPLAYSRGDWSVSAGVATASLHTTKSTLGDGDYGYLYYGRADATDGATPATAYPIGTRAAWNFRSGSLADDVHDLLLSQAGNAHATVVPTPIGSGYHFALDSMLQTANHSALNFGTADYTIELLFRAPAMWPNFSRIIGKKGIAAANAGWSIYWATGGIWGIPDRALMNSLADGAFASEPLTSGGQAPNTDLFYHIASRRQGGLQTIVANGIEVLTYSLGSSPNVDCTDVLTIGALPGNQYPLYGAVASIRLEAATRPAAYYAWRADNVLHPLTTVAWSAEERVAPPLHILSQVYQ